jgi:DNA-binding transcriptional ArsR family regulator
MAYGSGIEAKFEALAPATRRAVFEKLKAGPQSVGALAQGLPVSRPAVSQHLKVLKDAGLVAETKRGTSRIYALEPSGLEQMRDYFDRLWDDVLAVYKRSLEASDG